MEINPPLNFFTAFKASEIDRSARPEKTVPEAEPG
jgi:hypothetical protein